VLGDQAETVLAFWRHLDRMTPQQWATTWASAAAADAAPDRVAASATNEIQGAAVLRALGRPFFFLPMFGIAQPEDLIVSSEVTP
jgi:hypothetical protein